MYIIQKILPSLNAMWKIAEKNSFTKYYVAIKIKVTEYIIFFFLFIQRSLRKHMISHSDEAPEEKIVQPKPRKTRSDKGKPKPKFAMASVLSRFPISKEETKQILRSVSR